MSFERLFEPGWIGKLKVKNRFVRASMWTGYGGLDGSVSERIIRHYRELARGGAGLVNVEFSYIDNGSSQSNPCQLSIADDGHILGLSWLAMTIKQNGAMAGMQITHGGGQRYLGGPPRKVPSRSSWQIMHPEGGPPVEELTRGEIAEVVEAFGDAALRAKKACFDVVEVHGCHGYLITEFLSSLTNSRADEYGGTFENRMRFLTEIIQNVRGKVGADYPLCVRLNGSEYLEGGITIEETMETARVLERNGVNAIHISGGTHKSNDKLVVPSYWPAGYHVWAAQQVKEAVGIPVIVSGSITTPGHAEKTLIEGKADFIAMARPLLADPYLPKKAEQGRVEEIAPCIRCNFGCVGHPEGSVSCTVNIAAGREDEFRIRKTNSPQKVVVVGGGPAGMEAARVAAMTGHDVTLFEKRRLGGMLLEASVPDFKSELKSLTEYLSVQLAKHGVKVINQEADVEVIKRSRAEVAIIAAGAEPIVPDIPGVNKPITVGSLDVLNGAGVGEEVLVIGGGFVGCETALFLAEQKKKVTIVEMLDQILGETEVITTRLAFSERLTKQAVRILTRTSLEEITDDGILVRNQDGHKMKIEANTVVLALGLKTNDRLYKELGSCPGIDLHIIGDCVEPRKIYHAIHEGHVTARNL